MRRSYPALHPRQPAGDPHSLWFRSDGWAVPVKQPQAVEKFPPPEDQLFQNLVRKFTSGTLSTQSNP